MCTHPEFGLPFPICSCSSPSPTPRMVSSSYCCCSPSATDPEWSLLVHLSTEPRGGGREEESACLAVPLGRRDWTAPGPAPRYKPSRGGHFSSVCRSGAAWWEAGWPLCWWWFCLRAVPCLSPPSSLSFRAGLRGGSVDGQLSPECQREAHR